MNSGEEIDTHNIYVDPDGKFVSVRINTRLYRIHTIMQAADEMVHDREDLDVIVDGNPESEIVAKFIPEMGDMEKEELLRIAHKFNTQLVTSSGKG